jgi:23S rRNA (cytosine1962-C5)-methyltransferase
MPLEQRIVGAETVRMLELGHPWVIADAYTRKWPKGKSGQLLALEDEQGRFLATALHDPEDRVVARVLDRRRISLDRSWLLERLQMALRLRQEHGQLGETNVYRLVNAEGDGVPGLTVDRYGDFIMVQLYTSSWRPHLPLVVQVLQELLNPAGIYEKSRPQNTRELEASSDTKRYGNLLAGKQAPDLLPVLENGITYTVTLERGLNTGLFLDQRLNRIDLTGRSSGKRLLNLFSYTGSFSVAAAVGGASQVTSVDASPSYTEWARQNFGANRLNPKRHEFLVGDCFDVLQELARQGKRYDIVLMDPPSFSTTSRSRFTTRGGTSDLVAGALPLLEKGGLLISSSNHQKVDVAEYLKELRRGSLAVGAELRIISQSGQPVDFPYPVTFPEGRYLKYVVSVKG